MGSKKNFVWKYKDIGFKEKLLKNEKYRFFPKVIPKFLGPKKSFTWK